MEVPSCKSTPRKKSRRRSPRPKTHQPRTPHPKKPPIQITQRYNLPAGSALASHPEPPTQGYNLPSGSEIASIPDSGPKIRPLRLFDLEADQTMVCASVVEMPRKYIPQDSEVPYHIFVRSNARDWFTTEMPRLWDLFQDQLYIPLHGFEVELYSLVLMNNHFHFIAKFPKNNMSDFMEYFLRELSKEIGRRTGIENHKFKSNYGRCRISSNHYFQHCYKYVYRNPVDAGICKNVEDYPYSTLHGLLGRSRLWIPLENDLNLQGSEFEQTLVWMNTDYKKGDKEVIQKALKKSEFKLIRDRKSREPHRLEIETL